MKIVSWNILHIVHEKNYVGPESLVITEYNDESVRVGKIIAYIKNIYDKNDRIVINLQEVPGDVFDVLKTIISPEHFTYHTYQRIPLIKNKNKMNPYFNMNESLVTIIKGTKIVSTSVTEFESGKAALINKLNNKLSIYNVHMPFKFVDKVKITNRAIICGDFNCDMNEAETIFPGFSCFVNHNNTFITRRNNLISIAKYDHIMTNFNPRHSDLLVDKIDLSDHYPVSSTLYDAI